MIKLHEGRHSAASLQRDAAVGLEIRRKTLGHAEQAMMSRCTHIAADAHREAAKAAARLVEGQAHDRLLRSFHACHFTLVISRS